MSLTSAGADDEAGLGEAVPPHAATATIAPRADRRLRLETFIRRSPPSDGHVGDRVRPPLDEAVLECRDQAFGNQRYHGEQRHAGEDAIGVEAVLGVVD